MKFHWESKNGPYIFKKNINYVVYFKGCFAPPHVGHFTAISDMVLNNPNVKVIIDQIGSERRHGVPYKINRKIWKIYIDYLLPKNRVALHSHKKFGKYIYHPFMKGANKLIFLRANENFNIKKTEKNYVHRHYDLMNRYRKRGIKIEYYFQERDETVISATKFVEQLINCKEKNDNRDKLHIFMPKGLPSEIFHTIIDLLSLCRLEP